MKKVMVLRHVPLRRHWQPGAAAFRPADWRSRWSIASTPPGIERQRDGFDPAQWAGLVVMGGPMNVDETDRYPFLATEVELAANGHRGRACRRWASAWVRNCWPRRWAPRCGPIAVKEIGWYEIELLPAARDDRLFAGSQPRETVFQWHGDTFDLPPGAVQLARTRNLRAAGVSLRRAAYALQFHLEITAEMVADWLAEPAMCAEAGAAGLSSMPTHPARKRPRDWRPWRR